MSMKTDKIICYGADVLLFFDRMSNSKSRNEINLFTLPGGDDRRTEG